MGIMETISEVETASSRGCPFCWASRDSISVVKLEKKDVNDRPDSKYSFFSEIRPHIYECSACGALWSIGNNGNVYPIKPKLLSIDGYDSKGSKLNNANIPTSVKTLGPNEYRLSLGLPYSIVPSCEGLIVTHEMSNEDERNLIDSIDYSGVVVSEVEHFLSIINNSISVVSENDIELSECGWNKDIDIKEIASDICKVVGICGSESLVEECGFDIIEQLRNYSTGKDIEQICKLLEDSGKLALSSRLRAAASILR